jgi:EamA domain-containing membrane protein RarD
MKTLTIQLPELGLLIGTRAMASAGLALLLADKLDREQRKAVGWTLLATGIVTTIPLVALIFSKSCEKRAVPESAQPA